MGKKNPFSLPAQQETIDVVEILQWFKEHISQAANHREYISQLQARLMVPAHRLLQTKFVIWQPLSKVLQNEYEDLLKKIVSKFACQILSTHAPSLNHANTTLIRVLPSILQQNELNYELRPVEQLFTAVNANDQEKVRELVHLYSSLLQVSELNHIRMMLTRSCFNSSKNNINRQFFNFLKKFINLLSQDDRLIVILQYEITPNSLNMLEVKEIVNLLGKNKLVFLKRCHSLIKYSYDIMNFMDCAQLLDTKQEKKEFIIGCVQNYSTCLYSMDFIEIEERLSFFNQCIAEKRLENLFTPWQIIQIAKYLPCKIVFEFLKLYQDLFDYDSQILNALSLLSKNECLPFIGQQIENGHLPENFIRTPECLYKIVKYLPTEQRYIFCMKHNYVLKEKNKDGSSKKGNYLREITDLIDNQEDRKIFICSCVNDYFSLVYALKYLDEIERLPFIDRCFAENRFLEKFSLSNLAFRELAELLPFQCRTEFAKKYKCLNKNAGKYTIGWVYNLLNDKNHQNVESTLKMRS